MHAGDFYHGEKSMTLDRARDVKMELITKSGKTIVLKPKVKLLDRRSHRQHVHEQEGAVRPSTKRRSKTPARPA
jgi:monomeric isocitrate dehydrogenase